MIEGIKSFIIKKNAFLKRTSILGNWHSEEILGTLLKTFNNKNIKRLVTTDEDYIHHKMNLVNIL